MGKQTLFDPVLLKFYNRSAARHIVEYRERGIDAKVQNGIDYMLDGFDPEKAGLSREAAEKGMEKMAYNREESYVKKNKL